MPIISESFQSICMKFILLLRLFDVMKLILILSHPFSLHGIQPFVCDFIKNTFVALYSVIYSQISFNLAKRSPGRSFADSALQQTGHTHLEVTSHVGTQCEQTGQNLGHADLQVEEQFQPLRQYLQSILNFHRTFDTHLHSSTCRKCLTNRKTLGFSANHVNVIL